MYMHESKFLTKSLFPFLLRRLHAPAYAPSCTQRALLSPPLQPAPLLSHRGDLMEQTEHTSYSASCGKPVSWDQEGAATTLPEAPWKSNGEPGMGSASPFSLLLWYLWYRLGFLSKTLAPPRSRSWDRTPMPRIWAKGAQQLRWVVDCSEVSKPGLRKLRILPLVFISSFQYAVWYEPRLQIKATNIIITRQRGQCSDGFIWKASFCTNGN